MACSAVRSPIIRNTTIRNFSAAAAAQLNPASACSAQPESKVLDNKVTVAALDTNSPIAQVSIVFKAGSRNETYHTQGMAHYLRATAGLGTSGASYFGITRNIAQLGGTLSVVGDRESISYNLLVLRDNLSKALTFLEDVVTKQVFKPWEVSDNVERMRYEVTTRPEAAKLLDYLHKAAYKEGLGYSLYCPKRQLGKIKPEHLQYFVNNNLAATKAGVVATGIPLREIEDFASCLKLSNKDSPSQPTKYHSGEIRKERDSELASVAVALEIGGMAGKEKEALAAAILQRACGTGPAVKWGGSQTPLSKAVAAAASDNPFAVSAFNAMYSDAGLFGIVLSAPGNVAGSLVNAACKFLRSAPVTEKDIARGKAELKAAILNTGDDKVALHQALVQQWVATGNAANPTSLAAEIDKISAADVKNIASKLGSGKLSLAAIGDLSTVPYIDQLS